MPNTTQVEWQGATLTFVDSAWSDVMYLRLVEKFVTDGAADQGIAADVCYVLAHIDSAKGVKGWKPVDDTATPEQFRECYKGLLSQVDSVTEFYDLVRAVNDLKAPKAGALDKPDEALTPDEADDPN